MRSQGVGLTSQNQPLGKTALSTKAVFPAVFPRHCFQLIPSGPCISHIVTRCLSLSSCEMGRITLPLHQGEGRLSSQQLRLDTVIIGANVLESRRKTKPLSAKGENWAGWCAWFSIQLFQVSSISSSCKSKDEKLYCRDTRRIHGTVQMSNACLCHSGLFGYQHLLWHYHWYVQVHRGRIKQSGYRHPGRFIFYLFLQPFLLDHGLPISRRMKVLLK